MPALRRRLAWRLESAATLERFEEIHLGGGGVGHGFLGAGVFGAGALFFGLGAGGVEF